MARGLHRAAAHSAPQLRGREGGRCGAQVGAAAADGGVEATRGGGAHARANVRKGCRVEQPVAHAVQAAVHAADRHANRGEVAQAARDVGDSTAGLPKLKESAPAAMDESIVFLRSTRILDGKA